MKRHWSEIYHCSCGKTFRSYAAEAFHRHNFPALCRPPKAKRPNRTALDARTDDAEASPQSPVSKRVFGG